MARDFKDITIGEHQYRIGRLRAADGSWIFTTFVQRYRAFTDAQQQAAKAQQPDDRFESDPKPAIDTTNVDPEVGFAMTAQFLIEQLSRAELAEVESICLGSCGRYSDRTGTRVALPILFGDGRYAVPDLEYDGPAILELTKAAIAFNIAPYFPGAGSSGAANPATASSPQSTQT